jgi:hypothetical protein
MCFWLSLGWIMLKSVLLGCELLGCESVTVKLCDAIEVISLRRWVRYLFTRLVKA